MGQAREAAQVLSQALEHFSGLGDPDALVRCLHALYVASLTTGVSLGDIEQHLKAARANFSGKADARLAAQLSFMQSGALIDRDPAHAAEFAQAMLEQALSAGDVWLEALAHRSCGACATRRMLIGQAKQHFARCAEITVAAGRTRDLARVRSWQVMIENRCANFLLAERYGADGLQAAIAADATDIRATILANLANTAVWSGDLDTAERRLQESLALGAERGYAQPSISSLLGEVLIGKGEICEGIRLIERAWESSSPQEDALGVQRVHVPLLLGLAYLAADRTPQADRCAQQIRAEIGTFEHYYIHPQVYLWSAAQLLSLCGYGEDASLFLQAAQRRRQEILATIDDAASRTWFCRFVFNEFIESGAMVDDPLHAWFLPYRARRATAV
jgi:Tfp pilus assembly protein PilF